MSNEKVRAGENCKIAEGAEVGLEYSGDCGPVVMGDNVVIRSGAVIYCDVEIGNYFQSGHNVLVREKTRIGDHVVLGTNSVIDGNTTLGDFIKIETNCYIPTHVTIGNRVFLGPNVTLTNDRYPLRLRDDYVPEGPVIEDNVTIGAGAIVLPGVRIGQGSMIAAGAVVTKDVPENSLVTGIPGEVSPLPEKLQEPNLALSWRQYIDE